ncbi:MAG: SAM-dependent methyltransferase [Bacteroidales bacterium]|jgi:16S rRNA (cytidine1402-2'-O)-methyltransferase|nr:SAM-dependent methyltransferase [Bacteroidales bacterium]
METTLYLIPNILSDNTYESVLPAQVGEIVIRIRHFFVEDIKAARRFLIRMRHPVPIHELFFHELNEHTSSAEVLSFLPFLTSGDTGILSDAGVPALADPGAALVKLAHDNGIRVTPLVGPSSVPMALMASGMNGQSFAFNGYLPIQQHERIRRIQALEQRSEKEGQTQIFIETPYRNMQLLKDLLSTCQPDSLLCIASELTSADEFIATRRIRQWKQDLPDLNKKPTVFLLQRESITRRPSKKYEIRKNILQNR